jgi:hypothetical protein
VDRFPSGLIYLAPNPTEPFKRLTEIMAAAFPDWPPYGGAFDDVVPHLSIGENLTRDESRLLHEQLPIVATAEQVTLTCGHTTPSRRSPPSRSSSGTIPPSQVAWPPRDMTAAATSVRS